MAVLFPGKFIYLATPHTASIATTRALAEIDGAVVSDLNEVKDLDLKRTFPKGTHHATLEDLRRMRPEYFTGGEITVTTIRNPYDLLVTWWLRQRENLIKKWGHEPTFREYVEKADETTSGGPYIRDGRIFWMDVNKHMRYERLQKDLNRFLRRHRLPEATLEKTNVTANKEPYKTYYDPETRALAEQRFGEEASHFGYSF